MSIIVPLFNKAPFVGRCLSSVAEAVEAYGNAELIVVDNGSTDGSRQIIEALFASRARLLTLQAATISAVRNLGAGDATGEYLGFVDADCVVPRDYLFRLASVLRLGGMEVTGSQYGLPPSPTWVEEVWHRLHWRPGDGDCNYINAGNLVVSRRAFETVKGFDETLVTGEDAEICQRLSDAGFRIFESKSLVVAHLGNARTLRAFFGKEVWRGLGMFGTVRMTSIDKPTVALLVHLTALGTGGWLLVAGPGRLGVRLLTAALLAFVVPAAAVGYRAVANWTLYRPVCGVLLYQLYFIARAVALARIAVARLYGVLRRGGAGEEERGP